MSKASTIGKLEALLARVLARSNEPRVHAVEAAAPEAVEDPEADGAVDEPTIPPPAMRHAADEAVAEVTVASDGSDAGPDIVIGEAMTSEEALLDEVSDSRERLVAAQPVDMAPGGGMENEASESDDAEEEAPVSSRRPVLPAPEEQLAQLAFGAEEPPPAGRPPPPKSGPLPAPPGDFDADDTGVHRSVPLPLAGLSPRAPMTTSLTPHVAHLQLAESSGDGVADVIGEAQRFAPVTFLALLDSSLGL